MSFDSIESTQSIGSIQSNLTSEISVMSLEDNHEDILESIDEAEIFEESEDPRSEPYANEAEIFESEDPRSEPYANEAEIFEESEDPSSEPYAGFPNDAYKDLMILVTKHKLNNKTGNDIIRFFNKHSNIKKSPLPKNIEKGRAFMNNMNFSNLEFCKVLIANHKGKDYYLYYQDLIQCVKNILSVPNIA
jgi:hypothetical protein